MRRVRRPPWQPMAAGARHKVIERGGRRLRLVEIADTFVETDWCTRAHAGRVVEGTLELTFDGRVEHVAAGEGFVIPGGFGGHKARALPPRTVLFIVEDL